MEIDADGHDLLQKLSAPLAKLDPTSPVETELVAHCEALLTAAMASLDPSTQTARVLLDCIGLELPCILAKYSRISETCLEMSVSILKNLVDVCNPRDMFTAYMEALNLYSDPENLALCPLILDGLATIFTRIRARKVEFFRESILGLLGTAKLAVDTGVETSQIFEKLVQLVTTLEDMSTHEQEEKQKERLQRMLGIFILLLLASSCNHDELDNPSIAHSVVLQLASLLPSCGFPYSNLLTGTFLKDTVALINKEYCSETIHLLETQRGAAYAVYLIFSFDEVADKDHKAIDSLCVTMKSSKHVLLDVFCNVKVLLVPQEGSWKVVEHGIDLLSTMSDVFLKSADVLDENQLEECSETSLKLGSLLQVIQDVVIYCPNSKTRQQAYVTLVNIITRVLPPSERYNFLKVLIMDCKHPSMVSLLFGIVKEEAGKAINSRKEAALEAGASVQNHSSQLALASPEVIELIEYVLRPPAGGPPDLPDQIDAVVAVLNCYRFLLIRETTGKTNYTGISFKSKLQEAYSNCFLPLRAIVEGLRQSLSGDDSESSLYILLSLANLEGILYRCIELVEEAMRQYFN